MTKKEVKNMKKMLIKYITWILLAAAALNIKGSARHIDPTHSPVSTPGCTAQE